jgi:hypothetical protein
VRLTIPFLLLASFTQLLPPEKPERPLRTLGCPTINVTCPDTIEVEKPATFTADVSGLDAKVKPVYRWAVYGGTIIEGDGTSSIKVRPSGNVVMARVAVEGLDSDCSNIASCTLIQDPAPPSRLFDRYGKLRFRDEKARLRNFAIELRNEPGSQGYIIVYARHDDNAGAAINRAKRAKDFLVNDEAIEVGRIIIIDGGAREEPTVELYVVPTGALPPKPGLDSQD